MRLSVLINNYNYGEFVGIAIESALQQTHGNTEVIVVDDGSQDESMREIERFRHFITIISRPNGGQGAAYNAGFRAASGDIVLFLDSDDWLFATAAESIVAAWGRGVSKVQFPLEMVDRRGKALGRRVPREMSDGDAFELLKRFGTYNAPPGSGNAFDTQFLRKIMPIDEAVWRIAADTAPIMLAPAYGRIVSHPEPLGAYRLHKFDDESLLMNNAPADLWAEYRRIELHKRFVQTRLRALGVGPRGPLWLAPWEARLVAMCVRFGDRSSFPSATSRVKIAGFAVASVWRWPKWNVARKSLQSLWMLSIFVLPSAMARSLARRHKASVGAPVRLPA